MEIRSLNRHKPVHYHARNAILYFLNKRGGCVTKECDFEIPAFSSEHEIDQWVKSVVDPEVGVLETLGFDCSDFVEEQDRNVVDYYILRVYASGGRVFMDGFQECGYGPQSVYQYEVADYEFLYPFLGLSSQQVSEYIYEDSSPDELLCFHNYTCDVIRGIEGKQDQVDSLFSPYWSLPTDHLLRMAGVMKCAAFLRMVFEQEQDLVARIDTDPNSSYEVFYLNHEGESRTIFGALDSDSLIRDVHRYADDLLDKGFDNLFVDYWSDGELVGELPVPESVKKLMK